MTFFSEDKFNQVCHYKWLRDDFKRKIYELKCAANDAEEQYADAQKKFDQAAREFVQTWLKHDGGVGNDDTGRAGSTDQDDKGGATS